MINDSYKFKLTQNEKFSFHEKKEMIRYFDYLTKISDASVTFLQKNNNLDNIKENTNEFINSFLDLAKEFHEASIDELKSLIRKEIKSILEEEFLRKEKEFFNLGGTI